MNDLISFSYSNLPVRTIIENGDPWFVAKDVVEAIGAVWKRGETISHIPDEWKRKITFNVATSRGGTFNVPPLQEEETWFISEQGLYFYLMRSDKEAALPFQKWLAGEVLPSIRKTGSYSLPGSRRPVLESVKVDLELTKIRYEKAKLEKDLVLEQYILENYELTGQDKHKIRVEDAYKLYCTYAIAPLPMKEFAVNMSYGNRPVRWWKDFLYGLKKITPKQA